MSVREMRRTDFVGDDHLEPATDDDDASFPSGYPSPPSKDQPNINDILVNTAKAVVIFYFINLYLYLYYYIIYYSILYG